MEILFFFSLTFTIIKVPVQVKPDFFSYYLSVMGDGKSGLSVGSTFPVKIWVGASNVIVVLCRGVVSVSYCRQLSPLV